MNTLYPAGYDLASLSHTAKALKIARNSRCLECKSCSGLQPPLGTNLLLDSNMVNTAIGDLAQYGDDDDKDEQYLDMCACGHDVAAHDADEERLGSDEFARRARVAVRLDELRSDENKLLDFDFINEDIESLKRQIQLPHVASPLSTASAAGPQPPPSKKSLSPNSPLSDPPPPSKRRRTSESDSSLSDPDDEDDEDQPLASRIPRSSGSATNGMNGKRSGKKRNGKTVGGKKGPAPTSLGLPSEQPHSASDGATMNGRANGIVKPDLHVKIEVDDKQLSRLATGVTVDTGMHATQTPATARPEKAVYGELRQGLIRVVPVENDKQPRSLIILTGLKTLFQKQLPKMPREYIARLVYDTNSKALAIIKHGYKVVGGICYRPFPQRGFAEIVFFATASVDQVKGYGAMLMNQFKMHIKKTYPDMMHFLTYADNYAVGYFQKQGFSKHITLDRAVWAGYIKDYEGGTIMQCRMLPKVNYLEVQDLISQQKEAILSKIRMMSRSHVVHEGLPQFREGAPDDIKVDPSEVPGLRETGWTLDMQTEVPSIYATENPMYTTLKAILVELQNDPCAWPFIQPVKAEEVPDYYNVIKNPMDLSTMEHKLENGKYQTVDAFAADAYLMLRNCKTYNPETTTYYKTANRLEKRLKQLLDKVPSDE